MYSDSSDRDRFTHIYPFSAIVGQDLMKRALILNAINPRIGGVLIRGEKGTAKSTAVRAMAELLPHYAAVKGCTLGCDPGDPGSWCHSCRQKSGRCETESRRMRVVELPVSATEDKVVGSIDIEHAVTKGEVRFEPGILAKAHRNILYVDEVNLLNDHIVDVLLDAAAMGVNIVEREGVSFTHPSSFILIGTMNPEEGELRPQLLDRFGLCVEVEGIHDSGARIELIRRRLAYEQDPAGFIRLWSAGDALVREAITRAREILPSVVVPEDILDTIARICIDTGVDGHRADIAIVKTASTIAALGQRTTVSGDDVSEAALLVLAHRIRRRPFSDNQTSREQMEEAVRKNSRTRQEEESSPDRQGTGDSGNPDASRETVFPVGAPFLPDQSRLKHLLRTDEKVREGNGRRSTTESPDGRYVRSRIPSGKTADIAIDATLRAAARNRPPGSGDRAITVGLPDIREKVRERKTGNTTVFVVDASGSMGANRRMTAVKGAIVSLLIDAYQKRDRVGLVTFRGDCADLILPPTSSVELARDSMRTLPTGGRTPLAHGIMKGLDILRRERAVNRDLIPRLVLVSDGKANVAMGDGSPIEDARLAASLVRDEGIPAIVIDSEQSFISFGFAEALSQELGGKYVKLDELRGSDLARAVRGFGA